VARRPSGGRRRTLTAHRRRLGLPLGRPGCPKGTTTKKVAQLYLRIYDDLRHELFLLDPDWHGREISDTGLAKVPRKKRPRRYGHISLRTLRGYVGKIRSAIWNPRGKGANTLAKIISLRSR
jgi:hypothetical protein